MSQDLPLQLKTLYPTATSWGLIGSVGSLPENMRKKCPLCNCREELIVWEQSTLIYRGCANCTERRDLLGASGVKQLELFGEP